MNNPLRKLVADGAPAGDVRNLLRNSYLAILAIGDPKARRQARVENYANLMQLGGEADHQFPQASNTYSAALVTEFLTDGFATTLGNRWAAARAFTRDFTDERAIPLAKVQVPIATAGATVQENATDFESGDSVVDNVEFSPKQYSISFQVSNAELNSGLRMANLVEVNASAYADAIGAAILAPITVVNFPATPLVASPASFAWGDVKPLRGALKNSDVHNLILDGEYFSQLVNDPSYFQATGTGSGNAWGRFGWDYVGEITTWAGAGANVRGFASHPQAIGLTGRLPLTPPLSSNVLSEEVIEIPGLGLMCSFHSWFSLQTRTAWCSLDLILAAQAVDPTAGILIKDA